MADKAVESATAGMAEVRLDENGQPLSKNALKKLLKAEAAAKKKAEKAAAKVSPWCTISVSLTLTWLTLFYLLLILSTSG